MSLHAQAAGFRLQVADESQDWIPANLHPDPNDSSQASTIRPHRPSVLIVEDDRIVAAGIRKSLQQCGYLVTGVVEAGESVVPACAAQLPDLVLMDIRLRSDLDGVDAAAQVRAAFDIPVVFLTAHTDPDSIARAEGIGPFGFVVKPFGAADLDCAIRVALSRHAEQARVESRERLYRTLVESSPDLIAAIDDAGDFVYASPGSQTILDIAPEALECTSFFDLVDPLDRSRAMVLFARALKEEGIPHRAELRIRHRDGVAVPCEITMLGQSEDPVLPGVVLDVRDITRRRQEQAERRRLEEQVRRLSKMRSLGIMAGGIAHDFNNLLMTILGNAELAIEEIESPRLAERSIGEIRKAAQRASELTDQMLAYSGHGKLVPETIDLTRLVQDLRHAVEASMPVGVRMRYDLSSEPVVFEGDAEQVRGILMALAANAAEAIGEEPGQICIATGQRHLTEADVREVFVDDRHEPGPHVYLEVRDTGCGMDEETRQSVFDPFFTTKFMGRGLGLAAVLGIVRGHRGAIRVESRPDEGAMFRVYFPAVPSQAPALPELDAPALPPMPDWRMEGRVLLVDDEAPLRELGSRMLERVGLEVVAASDGAEGVEFFRRAEAGGEPFVCVILDLTMPRMGGREAFDRIREIRPEVPVLVASGYTREDVEREFAEDELAGFLHKPYLAEQLLASLRVILESLPGFRTVDSSD